MFRGRVGGLEENGAGGSIARRLRLAGTFFMEDEAGNSIRKAIVDDLQGGLQHIVSEGQCVVEISVVTVKQSSVLFRAPDGSEEELSLSFSARAGSQPDRSGSDDATAQVEEDKFGGSRMGEQRWVFSRSKLVGYYGELMNEPERLLKVFDSLKPEWTQEGKISGYRVKVEGEGDFFASVGLQESDIVRSVNTMKMTSRRRAEYFIKEFVENRLNAFVLDIERDGKPVRLVYEVR